MLVIKYIDRKTLLVIVPQDIQQKQEQPMMYSEFGNMTAHAIRVEDAPYYVDDLPHTVAEPTLDAAVDLCLELIEALLAGWVHAQISSVASATRAMQPSGAPEVKARG